MFRYPKINVIIYGGEGARKKCVVHGAFDRSAFGCAVIVLDPALNRNPSPGESKVYMQTRLLTVVECVRVFAWSEALAIQVYYWRTISIYFNATGDQRSHNFYR